MSPSYLSPLICSYQLSVYDNSFSDGQPTHNENICWFLCCLWLTSSTHLVYSTLFYSTEIVTSLVLYVPRMLLTLPLSSMSAFVFRFTQFLKQTVRRQRFSDVPELQVLRFLCCQDLPMQQFKRRVAQPSSTQFCIQARQ